MADKKRILEIDALRVLCIVMLLCYHSFAIFSGGWPAVDGMVEIPFYSWAGKFFYSFMLPLWVFISGYLWGYQFGLKKNIISIKGLISKKMKKLLLPALIFGFLYLLAFGNIAELTTPKGILIFLSGEGHLWFLPMLFWVFVFSYLILYVKLNDCFLLVVLLIVSAVSWNLPTLGIGNGLHYLFYFQLGTIIYKHRDSINHFAVKPWFIISCMTVFFITFIALTPLYREVSFLPTATIRERAISQVLLHVVSQPYQIFGILTSYGIAVRYGMRNKSYSIVRTIALYSFGIYIFHQFILVYLYYHTSLPHRAHSYVMPWYALLITLFMSVIFVNLCLRTKIGRFLLS